MGKFTGAVILTLLSAVSGRILAPTDWSNIRLRQVQPASLTINDLLLQNEQGRIVGGAEAVPHSLPYQVLMLVGSSVNLFYCGASLISNNYVLTSASSLYEMEFADVMMGVHNFTGIGEIGEHAVAISAAEFIVHKGWDPMTLENDIALVRLARPVDFNEYIQPVKLPRYSDVGKTYEGDISVVSGWGKAKNEDDFLSKDLRYVDVPVMNQVECGLIYLGFVKDSNICTVGDGGKGFCVGDGGGPLVHDNVQIGVVSFIYWSGCESGYPSVYARTTSYLDWIAEHSDVAIDP